MGKETYSLILVHTTTKAHGFKQTEDQKELTWIPLQYIGDMSYPKKGNIVEVEIDDWIAKEKGLI